MNLTNVRVKKLENNTDKVRALASIVFNDCFVVKDIRVVQGDERLFIAMPSFKRNDGKYEDIAHPINQEFREKIEKAILDEYRKC
jgi:stage V sporulation protein G